VSEVTTRPADELKRTFRRYMDDIWTVGEFDRLLDYVTPDYVVHDPLVEDLHGPDGVVRQVRLVHRLFADISFRIEDQIAEGNRLATRWTAETTHRASGQEIHIPGVTTSVFRDNRIAESWLLRESAIVLRAMTGERFLSTAQQLRLLFG
jgi:predicted ester cyclase